MLKLIRARPVGLYMRAPVYRTSMRLLSTSRLLLQEKKKPKPSDKDEFKRFFEIRFQRNDSEKPQNGKGNDNKDKGPNENPPWFARAALATIAFSFLFTFVQLYSAMSGVQTTWEDVRRNYLEKHQVARITLVNNATARVYLRTPNAAGQQLMYFTVGSPDSLERKLDQAQDELNYGPEERIPVNYTQETDLVAVLLSSMPMILLIGGFFYLARSAAQSAGSGPGGFGFGKASAKLFNQDTDVKVKFKDVAGSDEAKAEIMEFVKFLKNPHKYERLGARIPRGAILSGPPGTGKTLLAKATAGEAGVPFLSISGSEFVEMLVGVGAKRVRDLFETARKMAPSIVFIDEIDAIGKARGKMGGHDERESTLNQMLVEMDGFAPSDHVIVMAGTNRADILDPALLRPGRFDRHITMDNPDVSGRRDIFKVYLAKIRTDVDLEYLAGRLAALTPGFSGADVANTVNEAALIAARSSATSVDLSHFERAIERVIAGLEKKSRVLSPVEKKTVAFHEAGHAICGWFLQHADPLLKVSIVPRGQSLGFAQYVPSDVQLLSEKELTDRMIMTLGGRVSEEIHFDTVTSGASDDFKKVTDIATAMVTRWGMSPKVGLLNFEEDEGGYNKPFSEETGTVIDEEVRRIVAAAHEKCDTLLREKLPELALVANELLTKEVLTRDDMVRLLGKRPFQETNAEIEKYFDGVSDVSPAPKLAV